MENNCYKKRYMKFADKSGCILAEYNTIKDNENSILAVNNSNESGVFYYPGTMKHPLYEHFYYQS